ncbi:cyclin-dependent kinase inhibitor far1 [Entomortierella beljakovae]|nr:cyclin-dependent kinase inhibitor far1 [Entomortierella beljakovae]
MAEFLDASNAMEFYSINNTIFITGGSGFIGVTIIEKVLRSLPQVQKIYALVRVGPGSTIQERYEDLLKNRVFDTLKASCSNDQEFRDKFGSKIVPIKGDISLDNLGLSSEDVASVTSDTKVFIHCAASVNFDDPLETAFNFDMLPIPQTNLKKLKLNTLGTLRAITLAKMMPMLQSYVQVSTAFVVPYPKSAGERCMETMPPFPLGDPHEIFKMLREMSKIEFSNYEMNVVLKQYTNTYIFTKTLPEHIIQSQAREFNIPLVVVRPSIVTPAISEPVRGWAQGIAGLNGVMVVCGLGRVQEWAAIKDGYADFIPVDAVSSIVLSGATTADRTATVPRIYNTGVNHGKIFSAEDVASNIAQYWKHAKAPRKRSSNDIRCSLFPLEEFNRRFNWRFAMPLILSKLPGGGPIKKKLDKLYSVSILFNAFASNEWVFDTTKSMELDRSAPIELRANLDREVDWREYFHYASMGVHEFILRENVDHSLAFQCVTKEENVHKTVVSGRNFSLLEIVNTYWSYLQVKLFAK